MLDRYSHNGWWRNCGKPLTDGEQQSAVLAPSWRAATKSMLSKKWYNLRLAARNDLSGYLSIHHSKRYQKWNEIVYAVDPLLMPIVNPAIEELRPNAGLHSKAWEEFAISIRVDLKGACVDLEYRDIAPWATYRQVVAEWYLRGRLPCGWEGEAYSEDRRVVDMKGRLVVW